MPFGKCHAFGLPLVDSSPFVNRFRIPLTFTGHFNKGQLHMWSRCGGKSNARRLKSRHRSSSSNMAPVVFRKLPADFKKHFHGGAEVKSHQLERGGERLLILLEVRCDIVEGLNATINKDTLI